MNIKRYIILFVTACLGLSACHKEQEPSKEESPVAVAARIGSVTITEQDIENSLNLLSEQDRKFAQTSMGHQNLVQILTREKLILQDAHATGFEQDKDYLEAVAQKRTELEAILNQFKQEALVRTWYEKNGQQLAPSEKEIKAYYDKYPYEMTIKQIIIDNAQTADQVLRTLKASPGRWNEMARQHSIAPASLKTLTFMPGEYLENLEAVAANSPVGKVQGFFKTPQGFHIIVKTGEKKLSLKEATPRIEQILINQHLDELFDTLKTQYEVIIYDKSE